jgi:hypothetical protein
MVILTRLACRVTARAPAVGEIHCVLCTAVRAGSMNLSGSGLNARWAWSKRSVAPPCPWDSIHSARWPLLLRL